MPRSIADAPDRRHLVISETRPRAAKADLKKSEAPDELQWRANLGRAVALCIALREWNLGEFSAAVHRHPSQCGRWVTGEERAQVDTILAVPTLRNLFIFSLARVLERQGAEGLVTETAIRMRLD